MSVISHCQNQEMGLELKRCLGQGHVTTQYFGIQKTCTLLDSGHQETHLMFHGLSRVLSFIDSLLEVIRELLVMVGVITW